jgi:hypothetical protein
LYGFCLLSGEGVDRNESEAVKYFKMSCDQESDDGFYAYGMALLEGISIERDEKEGARFVKMSADRGSSSGRRLYGHCLQYGRGVAMNVCEALKYFRMARDARSGLTMISYEECFTQRLERPFDTIMDFSRFETERRLGCGGFGFVELMKDKESKECIAVKNIYSGGDFDRYGVGSEVNTLLSLDHRCVLRILGWSPPGNGCEKMRIATEYMSNGSLEDVLSLVKQGRGPEWWTDQAISVVIFDIIAGLQYIHSRKIIHRDIKPANIFLDEYHRAVVGDFGISELKVGRQSRGMIGTPRYMAPETLCQGESSYKVDVYAFGLILYEILVGESVFRKGASAEVIMTKHMNNWRPKIPTRIHGNVQDLIRK